MNDALPPVTAEVVAESVDGLTSRLRRKLDAAIESFGALPATVTDNVVVIVCGEDAQVTLAPGSSGVVTKADQATCSCLLAPRCLHRAAILSACPLADSSGGDAAVPDVSDVNGAADDAGSVQGSAGPSQAVAPTPAQMAAAVGLWEAGASILAAGVQGAGAVPQAELLRSVHTARLAGLHRCETAGLRVARGLRAARARQDGFHTADLVEALRELLLTTRLIGDGSTDPALIGITRRDYRPGGPLRVAGVCREPVLTATGYAGVVTHLIDDDGRWYSLADVKPGGSGRARGAGSAPVALTGASLDHAQLARTGLMIAGATVSAEGRLGAGRSVRATPTTADAWSQDALLAVLRRPWTQVIEDRLALAPDADPAVVEQAERALVGSEVQVVGPDGEGLRVREPSGQILRLHPALGHEGLAYVSNLRLIATRPGLRIRVLGRLELGSTPILRPLAVAPVPGCAATLQVPPEWNGHVDLGYDRLVGAHLPPVEAMEPVDEAAGPPQFPASGDVDSPWWRVSRLVEIAVSGGRRAAGEPTRSGEAATIRAALHRGGLRHGADLVTALMSEANRGARDVFGRMTQADPSRYAAAWLAMAMYARVVERDMAADHGTASATMR